LKVKITGSWRSEFVIKTQPTDESVSTLEAVAIALSQIEKIPNIVEVILSYFVIIMFNNVKN